MADTALNDYLKHIGNVRFVPIASTATLFATISNVDDLYDHALEQLKVLERSQEFLTGENIRNTIIKTHTNHSLALSDQLKNVITEYNDILFKDDQCIGSKERESSQP